MAFKAVAKHAPVIVTVKFPANPADQQMFVADRDYRLLEVIEVHRVAGAASSTAMLEKCASGVAPASGVDLLTAAFALDSTVDVPVSKYGVGLTAGAALIPRGTAIALDVTGTLTSYVGTYTLVLKPVRVENGLY
jgi:hypothetical protein